MKRHSFMLVLLFVFAVQQAASFEIDGGWGSWSGGLTDHLSPGAYDISSLPSVRRLPGSWHFETGWNRRYALAEFDNVFVAADYRPGCLGFAVAFSQFGSRDLYSEQTGRLSLAGWHRSMAAGIFLSYRRLDFNAVYPALSAATVGVSLTLDFRAIIVSVSADNLTRPSFDQQAPSVEPHWLIQAQLVSERRFSLLGGIRLERYVAPSYTMAQVIEIGADTDFFWSIGNRPWRYGGGLRIGWMQTTFSYAVEYHPALGLSHAVAIGLTGGRKNDDTR